MRKTTKSMQNHTNIKHIIIQAGGKGTRLEGLTRNKPKCLVPYDNLPIIFHLFRKFEGASFTIIADYKIEVLQNISLSLPKAWIIGFCARKMKALLQELARR